MLHLWPWGWGEILSISQSPSLRTGFLCEVGVSLHLSRASTPVPESVAWTSSACLLGRLSSRRPAIWRLMGQPEHCFPVCTWGCPLCVIQAKGLLGDIQRYECVLIFLFFSITVYSQYYFVLVSAVPHSG